MLYACDVGKTLSSDGVDKIRECEGFGIDYPDVNMWFDKIAKHHCPEHGVIEVTVCSTDGLGGYSGRICPQCLAKQMVEHKTGLTEVGEMQGELGGDWETPIIDGDGLYFGRATGTIEYRCPKCGNENIAHGIHVVGVGSDLDGIYCMACALQFVSKYVSRMEPVEEAQKEAQDGR